MGNPRAAYHAATGITGQLTDHAAVRYVRTVNGGARGALYLWGGAVSLSSVALLSWIVAGVQLNPLGILAAVMMITIEFIRLAQTATLWIFARMAHDPVPMLPLRGLRVAVHTTIVPAKEPFALVSRTLLAMKAIRYAGGVVDVWLLDEGNDPEIRAWCLRNGVNHFSRKGIAQWNTPSGRFKAKTKHGNLNSFHAAHGADYDIVAQMDPDHVPAPQFLERTLGYFADPDVGFVVAPQVYGNLKESFIARASAFQAYIFHGIIQRGGNGMRAPLLIGTNHLVRTSALECVGGYADSIIEDHLTSMEMFAKLNANGRHWKGVYTPDVLSVGEGPTSFADYFSQQQRWAYGIWQIALGHSRKLFPEMKPAQRWSFAMLQLFYPSVAISWCLSIALTGIFLTGTVANRPITEWMILWGGSMVASLGFFIWLRRFNLVDHERRDLGLGGMGLLLMCIPVYVKAAAEALLRRPLRYAVTAKGNLASPDRLRTFAPHLGWAAVLTAMLGVSLAGVGSSFVGTRVWLGWSLAVALAAVVFWIGGRVAQQVGAVFARPVVARPAVGRHAVARPAVAARAVARPAVAIPAVAGHAVDTSYAATEALLEVRRPAVVEPARSSSAPARVASVR